MLHDPLVACCARWAGSPPITHEEVVRWTRAWEADPEFDRLLAAYLTRRSEVWGRELWTCCALAAVAHAGFTEGVQYVLELIKTTLEQALQGALLDAAPHLTPQ